MSIFGDMFEDEADRPSKHAGPAGARNGGSLDLKIPPSPRLSSGLCGIYNQGATCYLNSLLQTLIMTPEFRGMQSNILHDGVLLLQIQSIFQCQSLQNQEGQCQHYNRPGPGEVK